MLATRHDGKAWEQTQRSGRDVNVNDSLMADIYGQNKYQPPLHDVIRPSLSSLWGFDAPTVRGGVQASSNHDWPAVITEASCIMAHVHDIHNRALHARAWGAVLMAVAGSILVSQSVHTAIT